MFTVKKAVALTDSELSQLKDREKAVAVAAGVLDQRKREYRSLLEALVERYDSDFEKNMKQSVKRYSAQVVDGILIFTEN